MAEFLRVCTDAVQKIVHAREFMISLVHACCMQAFGIKELNIKIMFKFSKPRTLDGRPGETQQMYINVSSWSINQLHVLYIFIIYFYTD